MDVVAELQRLKDYREQLRQLAKPGLGRFERYRNAILEEAAIEEVISNPESIEDYDDNSKILFFDYFIGIPLQEVLAFRGRFKNASPYEDFEVMTRQLQVLVGEEKLSQEELMLLPDLFHEKLLTPDDADGLEKRFFDDAKIGIKELFKTILFPGRKDALMGIFNTIAVTSRDYAPVCFINKQAGAYLSFEWEIIEGILRSPYFPDFFEECEREAGTPEIPYKYRNWPEREFFLQDAEKGKGVANYFILRSEVLNDFKTEEGYQHFRDFMDYLAKCGGISCDAYMESLLQLFTGFRFEEASRVVKWNGKNVRVLFYVLKYISNEKGRYQRLNREHGVYFPDIDGTDEGFFLGKSADPGNRLQDGKGIPSNIIESLHNYYDFFPALKK